MDTSDAQWVVQTLLESNTLQDFDIAHVTVNRDVLELLAEKLKAQGGIPKRWNRARNGVEL